MSLEADRLLYCRKVDAKISELLADRDLSRTWIHVDLDAFFASVEELGDPSLVISLLLEKMSSIER